MAGINLKDLNKERFSLVELHRKRCVVCSETTRTDDGREYSTSTLKQITGGDLMSVDEKFKKRKDITPFCKVVIDANTAPRFDDNSLGFKSRFRRVNFPYTFTENPDVNDPTQKQSDEGVIDRITTSTELSGYLNVLLDRAREIVRDKRYPTCDHLTTGYHKQVFSLETFVEDFCELDERKGVNEGYYVLAREIFEKFDKWAKMSNSSTMTPTKFGSSFGKMVGSASRPLNLPGRGTHRGYLGVKFNDVAYELVMEELEARLRNQDATALPKDSNTNTDEHNGYNRSNGLCENNIEKYRELKAKYGRKKDNFIPEEISQKPVDPVISVADDGSDVNKPLGACKGGVGMPSPSLAGKEDKVPYVPVAEDNDAPTIPPGPNEGSTCPVCGEGIGPGHSSSSFEGNYYCTNCAMPLAMIIASAKALTRKNGVAPTVAEIHQDVTSKGNRPPRKQHLPAMLRCLGFMELDGRWVESSECKENDDEKPDSLEIRLKSALEQLQCEGKPIVPHVLAESLGCKICEIADLLEAMGYKKTNEIDRVSHMIMWIKDDDTSGDAVVSDVESSSSNVNGETNIDSHLTLEKNLVNAGE